MNAVGFDLVRMRVCDGQGGFDRFESCRSRVSVIPRVRTTKHGCRIVGRKNGMGIRTHAPRTSRGTASAAPCGPLRPARPPSSSTLPWLPLPCLVQSPLCLRPFPVLCWRVVGLAYSGTTGISHKPIGGYTHTLPPSATHPAIDRGLHWNPIKSIDQPSNQTNLQANQTSTAGASRLDLAPRSIGDLASGPGLASPKRVR